MFLSYSKVESGGEFGDCACGGVGEYDESGGRTKESGEVEFTCGGDWDDEVNTISGSTGSINM